MDKRVIHLAAGIAVVTALGGLAGAGHDRGVVELHRREVAPSPKPTGTSAQEVVTKAAADAKRKGAWRRPSAFAV